MTKRDVRGKLAVGSSTRTGPTQEVPIPPDTAQTSAAARHELLLVRLLALIRAAALCLAASALAVHWHAIVHPGAVAAVLVLLVLDNVALVRFHGPRGMLGSRLAATLDVGVGMAALVLAVALLKPKANPSTDDILYPYTVAAVLVIGLAYRGLGASVAAGAVTSAIYVLATGWRFGLASGAVLLANAATYWAWAVGGWFVVDRIRVLSAGLDRARRTAAAQEAELAGERERSRHARELHAIQMAVARRELQQESERARLSRALHDHVLQTLEVMGRDAWIADPTLRDHVAAEAAWLRDLVRGGLGDGAGAVAGALDRVAEWHTRAGMRIELNTSGLGTEPLPAQTAEAITGAVCELLTNVRKHAGTNQAVVRAVSAAGKLTVTVLDHGRGFDPDKATGGVGLRESVIARVREVGGRVVVTGEPGVGTHVEISFPVPAAQPPPSCAVPEKHDMPPGQAPARMQS
jgi:signal transduction histidine kinase